MDTTEQARLLDDVEAFCVEVRPSEELAYVEHRFNDQAIPLARKHDLLGMPIATVYGGRGADAATYARALARIGREGTGLRTLFSGHISIGQLPIAYWGTDEQKRRLLPATARGERICAFALTEPDAGSNPLELQTTYERRGDRFVLNGVKYLISNGGIADLFIAFAYPKNGPRRMSAMVVEAAGGGIVREDLTAKMGMPTANTAMFEMQDCAVPVENLLGQEGNGFRIAMHTLVAGRLSVAAGCLGVIEDCLTEAAEYAKQRCQHGKPIAKHQLVQQHIARIEVDRAATEALVMKAAAAKSASDADPTSAALQSAADLACAQAKFFASNAAWDAADRAVQVFGGRGYSELYRPARHLQDVRVCRIYEGTDEILQLKIATAVLGKEFEAFR
jgi:alkylation response protein AidB-like acyl-CoA dehydrogenase